MAISGGNSGGNLGYDASYGLALAPRSLVEGTVTVVPAMSVGWGRSVAKVGPPPAHSDAAFSASIGFAAGTVSRWFSCAAPKRLCQACRRPSMELPGASYLSALATISVTFVGFSALLLVFRQTIGGKMTSY